MLVKSIISNVIKHFCHPPFIPILFVHVLKAYEQMKNTCNVTNTVTYRYQTFLLIMIKRMDLT